MGAWVRLTLNHLPARHSGHESSIGCRGPPRNLHSAGAGHPQAHHTIAVCAEASHRPRYPPSGGPGRRAGAARRPWIGLKCDKPAGVWRTRQIAVMPRDRDADKLRPDTNEIAFRTVPAASPAMAAGLTDHVWMIEEVLERTNPGRPLT